MVRSQRFIAQMYNFLFQDELVSGGELEPGRSLGLITSGPLCFEAEQVKIKAFLEILALTLKDGQKC